MVPAGDSTAWTEVRHPTIFNTLGRIQWNDVRMTPGAKENFPTEPDGSHYYAARETDAAPLTVGSQQEKFLFYRGLASFRLPLSATITGDGRICCRAGESAAGSTRSSSSNAAQDGLATESSTRQEGHRSRST